MAVVPTDLVILQYIITAMEELAIVNIATEAPEEVMKEVIEVIPLATAVPGIQEMTILVIAVWAETVTLLTADPIISEQRTMKGL